jgi:spore coat protein U-like protein
MTYLTEHKMLRRVKSPVVRMTGLKLLAAVSLIIAVAMEGSVSAAQIQPTVTVTGAISGVCRAGAAGSLSFSIDPTLAGPIAATVTNATIFCSNGMPFTVTAASLNKGGAASSCASSGGGITGTLQDGVNMMDYTFTCGVDGTSGNSGTGKGHGSGKDVDLGISGSIAAISYQDAPVSASYTDTITLTVTY